MIIDARAAMRGMIRLGPVGGCVVVSIAVAIAINSTLADIVYSLLLAPPGGIADVSQLRVASMTRRYADGSVSAAEDLSYPSARILIDRIATRGDAAVFTSTMGSLLVGSQRLPIMEAGVSETFFQVLGTRAALGRLIGPFNSDASDGVLSFDTWVKRFSGDSGILGRTVDIDGIRVTVIGVTERPFVGVAATEPAIWLPLSQVGPKRVGSGWR